MLFWMTTTPLRRIGAALIGGVLLLLVGTTAVRAQGAGPFDLILTKLDAILAAVSPAPDPTVLSTGTMPVTFGDTAWCLATNVGTQPISVTSRVVDSAGTILASATDASLQPGHMNGTGYDQQFCYCRCEFSIGGSSRDVRATMAVGPGDDTRAVLDAR
jgi:hypothetical protein